MHMVAILGLESDVGSSWPLIYPKVFRWNAFEKTAHRGRPFRASFIRRIFDPGELVPQLN